MGRRDGNIGAAALRRIYAVGVDGTTDHEFAGWMGSRSETDSPVTVSFLSPNA